MSRAAGRIGRTFALLVLVASAPLAAQGTGLDTVASLSLEGRTEGAREALAEWWGARWEDASGAERQRALWLRATLQLDAGEARGDFTRLVLEHPGGSYSAQALLRLAQEADVHGAVASAAGHYEALVRGYPDSPHRLEARRWLEEHREGVALARAPERAAGEGPFAPAESPGPPVSIGTNEPGSGREGAESPEDDSGAVRPSELVAEDGEVAAEEDVGDVGSRRTGRNGVLSVQLGAFSTVERAGVLLRNARGEGIEELRMVRVPGSDLVRVRAGRFSDPGEAAQLLARIESRGQEATIVQDADQERSIP